jgi:ubiquinone/menaquinone biosynthesis C-methylase UbiE
MSGDPYRRTAPLFDLLYEPMNRGLRLIGLRMFPPTRGMTVLDVGCGTGTHLELYRQSGCVLCGIDTSPAMVQVAKRRLADGADLRLANACDIPFGDESFDLVISMLALHEMDPETRPPVVAQMKRVLRREGRILLIDFHPGPYRFFRGWFTKAVIFFAELTAGRRHFRNYRQFMSVRGLSPIIGEDGLHVVERKVVGGGALVLYLLCRTDREPG